VKPASTAFLALLVVLLPSVSAAMEAETLAQRVGQVFAGYDDFWLWVTQTFRDPDGRQATYRGRAYFKRDRMFRLNFGQPPFLIHGTDGDEYWIYDADAKVIKYSDVDEDTPVHPLVQVFAAGDRMVRALDRFFDVEGLEEVDYAQGEGENRKTVRVWKLVLSLKPGALERLRERDNLADADPATVWTFWVDQEESLPLQVQLDWETGRRYVFALDRFHENVGLSPRIFRRPRPPGVRAVPMKTDD